VFAACIIMAAITKPISILSTPLMDSVTVQRLTNFFPRLESTKLS
jgi:hypothetical protein